MRRLQASPENVKLARTKLAGTNTLAYVSPSSVTKKKSFATLSNGSFYLAIDSSRLRRFSEAEFFFKLDRFVSRKKRIS